MGQSVPMRLRLKTHALTDAPGKPVLFTLEIHNPPFFMTSSTVNRRGGRTSEVGGAKSMEITLCVFRLAFKRQDPQPMSATLQGEGLWSIERKSEAFAHMEFFFRCLVRYGIISSRGCFGHFFICSLYPTWYCMTRGILHDHGVTAWSTCSDESSLLFKKAYRVGYIEFFL